MARIANQDGIVMDALSAGPIEGLVDGLESIYLEGAPYRKGAVIDPLQSGIFSKKDYLEGRCSTQAGTNFIDVPIELVRGLGNGEVDFSIVDMYIWIEGAAETFTIDRHLEHQADHIVMNPLWGYGSEFYHTNAPMHSIPMRKCADLQSCTWAQEGDGGGSGEVLFFQNSGHLAQTWVARQANYRGYYKNFYNGLLKFNGQGELNRPLTKLQDGEPGAGTVIGDKEPNATFALADVGGVSDIIHHHVSPDAEIEPGVHGRGPIILDFDHLSRIESITFVDSPSTTTARVTFYSSNVVRSTIPRPLAKTLPSAAFKIIPGQQAYVTGPNFKGAARFFNGERDQAAPNLGSLPLTTSLQVQPNSNLEWGKGFGGEAGPVIVNSSGAKGYSLGLQPNQIPNVKELRFAFVWPNGSYWQNKDGDKKEVVTELKVDFYYRSSPTEAYNFVNILGRGALRRQSPANNSNLQQFANYGEDEWETRSTTGGGSYFYYADQVLGAQSPLPADYTYWAAISAGAPAYDKKYYGTGQTENFGGVFIKKENRQVVEEVTLDIGQYDFTEFYIEVTRVTPHRKEDYFEGVNKNSDDYKFAGYVNACGLQLVQVNFADNFTYPLTALGAIAFSGGDFPQPPTRGYHCRGLKVKVPSNYVTREENAAMGHPAIASYDRKVVFNPEDQSYTINTGQIQQSVIEIGSITDPSTQTLFHGYNPGGAGTIDNSLSSVYSSDTVPNIHYIQTQGTKLSLALHTEVQGATFTDANDFFSSLQVKVGGITYTFSLSSAGEIIPNRVLPNGKSIHIYSWTTGTVDLFNASNIGEEALLTVAYTSSLFKEHQRWSGTFRGDENLAFSNPDSKKVYTNNPAWVYYDLLTNPDYGLGDYINEEEVNVFELYQIARYCDELVPDGRGGLEPRFACNVYLTKEQEAYKVLKDLASTFRGIVLYMEGQVTAIQDRPKEPVYLFTQGNVIDGQFNYEYTGTKSRTNSVTVTWNDPNQMYKQDTITVDDHEDIVRQGRIVEKSVVAFGCTSLGQAKRVGRWHLATDLLETEVIKFKTSLNAMHLRVGDVIGVQDQELTEQIIASGRLRSSDGHSFKFDREVNGDILQEANEGLTLHIIVPQLFVFCTQDSATINSVAYKRGDIIQTDKDGNLFADIIGDQEESVNNVFDDAGNIVSTQIEERGAVVKRVCQLVQGTEKLDTVVITTPIVLTTHQRSDPDFFKEKIWALTSSKNDIEEKTLRKYRILGIAEDNFTEYTITAGLYIEEKYDEVDSSYAVYTDPIYDGAAITADVSTVQTAFASLVADFESEQGKPASVGGYDLIIEWSPPTKTFTDSNGSPATVVDGLVGGYILTHNAGPQGTTVLVNETIIGATNTYFKVPNVDEGEYTISIKTFNIGDNSRLSPPFTFTKEVTAPIGSIKIANLGIGGDLNKPVHFSSAGLLTILNPSLFQFTTIANFDYIGPSTANTSSSQVSFASMSNSSVAYWLYNQKGADLSTSAPWKVAQVHTDNLTTTGQSLDTYGYTYFKELGASNNGLSTLTTGATLTVSNVELLPLNRVQVTFTSSHFMADGDSITFSSIGSGSTVELNSNTYVITNVNETTVILLDSLGVFTNGGGFTPYNSGVARGVGTRPSSSTITIDESTTRLKGKNTSFKTDFKKGDYIKLSTSSTVGTEVATSEYHVVDSVVDNHNIELSLPVSREYGAVGAVLTVDTISGADAERAPSVVHTDITPFSVERDGIIHIVDRNTREWGSGEVTGIAPTFKLVISSNGTVTSVTPMRLGKGFAINDTITIADSDITQAGLNVAADITFDVASISTSGSAFKMSLDINRSTDCVLAEVTKGSGGDYSIEFYANTKGLDTSAGLPVNNTSTTSVQGQTVFTSSDKPTLPQTILTNQIDTPQQAAGRQVSVGAHILGKIGHKGPEIAVTNVALNNPILVTSAVHGLSDFQRVTFTGFTDTVQLNSRSYYVARGDGSDASTNATKFRLFDTLNRGVVQTVSFAADPGGGFNTGVSATGVPTTTNDQGSGLKLDVTTNGSGVISAIAISSGFAGTGYEVGDLITLDYDGGSADLGNPSDVPTIQITAVDFELADGVNGGSGFTSPGSYTNTKFQQVNACTLNLKATIQESATTATIVAADIDSTTAKSFSSPYIPSEQTWTEWQLGYGGGHAHSTFTDLVSSKNLFVGATLAQASTGFSAEITFVSDQGTYALVNTNSTATSNSTSDITVAYNPSSGLDIKTANPQHTLVDSTNAVIADKTMTITGTTGSIQTVGDITVELQGKTDSPSVATLQSASNLFAASDCVFTTEKAHGFSTGTPVVFDGVVVRNGSSTGSIINPSNGAGLNNSNTYFVDKTSSVNFKLAKTRDGSNYVQGTDFFATTDDAGIGHVVSEGIVRAHSHSLLDEVSLVVNATT